MSVPDSTYGCAVNLINDGVTISDGMVTIQFAGVGRFADFVCFLDGQTFSDGCKITFILKHCNLLTGSTPVQLEKLESGWHVVKILAVGDDCVERQPLKVNFLV